METNLLLKSYLKKLRLPTMRRDLEKALAEATQANLPYERFLLGLVEQEIFSREENTLRAHITTRTYLGSKWQHVVDTGSGTLKIETTDTVTNDRLSLYLPPDSILLFPEEK